jgi:hypothetical protein
VYYDKNSDENSDNDDLEEPVELNFEDEAGAAAANNQGRGEGNRARAPQGPAAAANNQGGGEEVALELLKAMLVLLTIKDME